MRSHHAMPVMNRSWALLCLILTHALVDAFAIFIDPLWPSLRDALELSQRQLAVLMTLWALAPSLSQVGFGYLQDRYQTGSLSLAGPLVAVGCLALLGLAPSAGVLMVLLLAGETGVDPLSLASLLLKLVVVPLLASRLILASPLKEPIARWRGRLANWAFALVLFTITGLNREAFFGEPRLVLLIGLVNVIRTFGLAIAIDAVLKRRHEKRAMRTSYVLMATLKNSGFAAATALALFGERTAIPSGVAAAVAVLYLVWLGMRWGLRGEG